MMTPSSTPKRNSSSMDSSKSGSALRFQACTRTQSKDGAKVPTLVATAIDSAVARGRVRSPVRSDPHASGSRARSATIEARAGKPVSRAATGLDQSASRIEIVFERALCNHFETPSHVELMHQADKLPSGLRSHIRSAYMLSKPRHWTSTPIGAQRRTTTDKTRTKFGTCSAPIQKFHE